MITIETMDDNKALERAGIIAALRAIEVGGVSKKYCGPYLFQMQDALMDAADLIEQLTAEPSNEPLTVDELRGMDMAIIKAMFGDADVKRMKELCEADKEGRAVVLPEDGMLYHFEEIPVGIPFDFSQLGKTVFLTRAEAEAALGGGNQ